MEIKRGQRKEEIIKILNGRVESVERALAYEEKHTHDQIELLRTPDEHRRNRAIGELRAILNTLHAPHINDRIESAYSRGKEEIEQAYSKGYLTEEEYQEFLEKLEEAKKTAYQRKNKLIKTINEILENPPAPELTPDTLLTQLFDLKNQVTTPVTREGLASRVVSEADKKLRQAFESRRRESAKAILQELEEIKKNKNKLKLNGEEIPDLIDSIIQEIEDLAKSQIGEE